MMISAIFESLSLLLFLKILWYKCYLIFCFTFNFCFMSKVSIVSRSLFGTPVPLERKPFVKTYHLGVVSSDSGESVIETKCVETEMNKIVALDYVQTTLSTLVAKGIDPHSLDIIDSSKLGCDAGIDELASYLVNHTSDYVVLPKNVEESAAKLNESK